MNRYIQILFKNKLIAPLIFLLTGGLLFILDSSFPIPKEISYSKVILSKKGELLNGFLSEDDKWRMRSEARLTEKFLVEALFEKEDRWFYWHFGVNPLSILRAGVSNITAGEVVSGASTITMQVARLLEPKERTLWNKALEILRAIQLELHYSKDEIFDLYLSTIPFGGNIEGVKAASFIYFNRSPDKLSLAQSALLAVIPNNPNLLRPDLRPNEAKKARNRLLNEFIRRGTFPEKLLRNALEEPLNVVRNKIPNEIPHLSRYLTNRHPEDIIKTNINSRQQKLAERLLINHIKINYSKGISNGAVLIIENDSLSVSAYCGSADFGDNENSGQVDGIRAIRSPGSTLKTGLYCLGLDLGIITPASSILDIPKDFGGYQPENFDLEYHGSVSAQFALVNSLNIPAVRLLERVGTGRFISHLSGCGFETIGNKRDQLGLSLILGGCGTTLEELTKYYSIFARAGKKGSLRYLKTEEFELSETATFSPEASYLISEILHSNDRPDIPAESLIDSKLPQIAWKTGTSYGKRDAWAIGYNPAYTIGVWIGNFNGKGSPYLNGRDAAVPLLFSIFGAIDYDPDIDWYNKPVNVASRNVCAESGLLPSVNCENLISDYYIKGITEIETCNLSREYFVDDKNRYYYCFDCLPVEGFTKRSYPNYSPELLVWNKNETKITGPPPHNPYCEAIQHEAGLEIISPVPELDYFILKDSEQSIALRAASKGFVETQYWYINDHFFGISNPGEKLFFKPRKNRNKITCFDESGNSSTVQITVEFY